MYHRNVKYFYHYLVGLCICFLACCTRVQCASVAPPLVANLTTRAGPIIKSVTPPTDIINLFSKTSQVMDNYSQGIVKGTPMEGGGNPTEKVPDLTSVLMHENVSTPNPRPATSREGPKYIEVGLNAEKTNTILNATLPKIIDNVHESSVGTENDDTLNSKSNLQVQLGLGLPESNSMEVDLKLSKIHARKGAENSKINARKGAELSTIVGRKGAVLEESEQDILNSSTVSSTIYQKNIYTTSTTSLIQSANVSVAEINSTTERSVNLTGNSAVSSSSPILDRPTKLESSSLLPNVNNNRSATPAHIEDSTTNTTDIKIDTKGNIVASYPPLKKKLKPLKTVDTNSFPDSTVLKERTSSQHEYVVPIVVAILTVPMLIVLALFIYKKGSEFWERRHYRRMDFLIDGMYND